MQVVKIETNAENKGHYVPGIISRGMLYVSGQLPVDHELGKMVTTLLPSRFLSLAC